MNIYEALNNVIFPKQEYFKWKHNIRYDKTLPIKSEEEFLKYVNRKSLNGFIKWEKSNEYKQLLVIYLESLIANDLDAIYKVVREKALTGDPQSVKLFLQIQKDISSAAKISGKAFNTNKNIDNDLDEEDELEI